MTAIWQSVPDGKHPWKLISASPFLKERELHKLVAETPAMLPLSGQPQIAFLGSEVRLSTGVADIVAVESDGTVVIIEVKLSNNQEAKKAVVAQILGYAAAFRGMSLPEFNAAIATCQRPVEGFTTASSTAERVLGPDTFDTATFDGNLEESLRNGRFRLVLVLDEAPQLLTLLVGYLESVTVGLVIDLITVSMYDVNGTNVVIPQFVEPEKQSRVSPRHTPTAGVKAPSQTAYPGTEEFESRIATSTMNHEFLRTFAKFAKTLKESGHAKLVTNVGTTNASLVPIPPGYNAGLCSASVTRLPMIHRTVIESRAPETWKKISPRFSEPQLQQSFFAVPPSEFSEELFALLREAYAEASTISS